MTALQHIIKEAKSIRKKYPNKEWKDCVKQASAIYASKHKGKSPVGKKKAVKKTVKKKVGAVKKIAKKSLSSHKDTKSHNVNIRVVSGVSVYGITRYKEVLKDINYYQEAIERIKKGLSEMTLPEKKRAKEVILSFTKIVKELKTHAKELKKHI